MRGLLALAAVASLGLAQPTLAANADNPQANVDKSNDKGGDTGNSRVDDLNRKQLDGGGKREETPTK